MTIKSILIPAIPICNFEMQMEATWNPTNWPAAQKLLNPWADPLLERWQLLRFNTMRAAYVRGEVIRKWVWKPATDWLEHTRIEAEYEFYLDRHEHMLAAEREYIIETYLRRDLESDWPAQFKVEQVDRTAMPPPYESDDIFAHGALDAVLPIRHPLRVTYDRRWVNPGFEPPTPPQHKFNPKLGLVPLGLGGLSFAIQASFDHLFWELFLAAKESNALSGASARQRALFVNDLIPAPNDYTWLAWWNICGLAFTELAEHEKGAVAKFIEAPLTHYIQFLLPCLPMTREHRSGSQLLGDDSHSDHSLTSKSGAHTRNEYGRILHGRWEVSTFLLSDSAREDGVYTVANQRISTMDRGAPSHIDEHAAMLPRFISPTQRWHGVSSRNRDVFLARATETTRRKLCGVVNDPYLTYADPLPFHWAFDSYPVDTGFRSLAKFNRVHFRFDESEDGADAATAWRAAFVDCAIRWMGRNDSEHSALIFESALLRQTSSAVKAGGGSDRARRANTKANTDFGLKDLF